MWGGWFGDGLGLGGRVGGGALLHWVSGFRVSGCEGSLGGFWELRDAVLGVGVGGRLLVCLEGVAIRIYMFFSKDPELVKRIKALASGLLEALGESSQVGLEHLLLPLHDPRVQEHIDSCAQKARA